MKLKKSIPRGEHFLQNPHDASSLGKEHIFVGSGWHSIT